MEAFSALLALNSPITGEFLSQRPVTRSFDVSFDLHVNKRLSKQPRHRWFETPWCPLWRHCDVVNTYYSDVTIRKMASQVTDVTIVYSTVCPCVDQSAHQSSASQAFVRGNPRWPVNSPHKGTLTRKMFPFDDVIIELCLCFNKFVLS